MAAPKENLLWNVRVVGSLFSPQLSRPCASARKPAHGGATLVAAVRNRKEKRLPMNSHKTSQLCTILLGPLGLMAMLLLSTPSCKAQEISPDHFTEVGVQDVYAGAPVKVAAPNEQQKALNSQTRRPRMGSPGALQPTAKSASQLHVRHGNHAVAKKRKPALSAPKKP